MKFPPHYFEDLLYALERKEAELIQVTNAITAFCQGIEDKWLDKVVAFVLSRSERGSVERSVRNLGYSRLAPQLASEYENKAEAHRRLSDVEIRSGTIEKITRAAADGEGIELAMFIICANAGHSIDLEIRQAAQTEGAKIRALLLSNSSNGREERAKFGEWAISDIGKSGETAEILEDIATYRKEGLSKTVAREKAGAPHGLSAGAARLRVLRSDEERQRAESKMIETLTKPRANGQPETLIVDDVFDAVLAHIKAGRPENIAFELVSQPHRLSAETIKKLFEEGKIRKAHMLQSDSR